MLEVSTIYDPKEKIWTGTPIQPLFNPNASVGHVILKALQMHGKKVAQISDDFCVESTFDEILMKTIRAAQNLQKDGYEKQSVFGIVASNRLNLAPVVFAALSLGCVINPLDPSFGRTELIHMWKTVKPKVVFCDIGVYELVKRCLIDLCIVCKIYTFNGQRGDSISVENLFIPTNDEANFVPVDVDGVKDTAAIISSSSTIGLAKGVCLSHAVLLDRTSRLSYVTSDDVIFAFSTIYWLSGIGTLLRGTLYGATRIITTHPFSPALLIRLIEQYKITILLSSKNQIMSTLYHDESRAPKLPSVRICFLGRTKIPSDQYAEMKKLLPNAAPYNAYGLSELGGSIALNIPHNAKQSTVGKLISGITVKIVDNYGSRLGIGEVGRLCVKSPFPFIGYHGDRDSTISISDAENFLLTGDTGYFDDEGFLYHATGRYAD